MRASIPAPCNSSHALLTSLRHFWLAPTCPICSKSLLSLHFVCDVCHQQLEQTRLPALEQKALPFMSPDGRNLDRLIWYERHLSLFGWNRAWQKLLHSWKYDNDRKLYKIFLNTLEKCMQQMIKFEFDRLVIIDSGAKARRKRGYQPCQDLAPFLARGLGIEFGLDLVKKASRLQSKQLYRQRFFEMHGALQCRSGVDYSGRHVLLFEDVFTTGATANEAARLIKSRGAREVSICSLVYREDQVTDETTLSWDLLDD